MTLYAALIAVSGATAWFAALAYGVRAWRRHLDGLAALRPDRARSSYDLTLAARLDDALAEVERLEGFTTMVLAHNRSLAAIQRRTAEERDKKQAVIAAMVERERATRAHHVTLSAHLQTLHPAVLGQLPEGWDDPTAELRRPDPEELVITRQLRAV